jgi:DNA-binding transcriptional MocR family regulator
VSEPFRIDPDAPKLINVQVADHITARIRAGDLAPGARLAAERDLATQYGVSYDTIRRATALLRDRELIIVAWQPCECGPAAAEREHGPGHLVVHCQAPGCRSAWYRPRCEPSRWWRSCPRS